MFFLYPFVLVLLAIPMVYFIYSFKMKRDDFEKHFSFFVLQKLMLKSSYFSTKLRYRFFLLTLALFIFALASPVKELTSLPYTQSKPSVILAVDISKSMQTSDVYPTRFILAKAKLTQLLSQATGLNIGILFYAKHAYVLYPLSQNPRLLSSLLQDINLTQSFSPNSNLFSAIEGSALLLKNQKNKHIILLSDGGEDVPRTKELAYLKSQGIKLSTLATNSKNHDTLQTLCIHSAGIYVPYTLGDDDIHMLLANIKRTKTSKTYHNDLVQHDVYFAYPLFLAMVLLLLLFLPIRKNISLLWLLGLLHFTTLSTPLHAGLFDFWHLSKASKLYEEKSYNAAITSYTKADLTQEGYYNLATTFYKSKQYTNAIVYYKKAWGNKKKMNAKIYYNIATSYARKNKLDLAKAYYKKSLQIYTYKIALENLNLINIQLKIQRKNLHKKYKELQFKALSKNVYASNNVLSNYVIKIDTLIPSEEEQWFTKILEHKTPLYLQKLNTTKRSIDADIPW